MQTLPRSLLVRTVVIPVTLLAFLSGCHKWSTVDASPGQYLNEDQPEMVRVTWHGELYEVRSPVVQADSITGQAKDESRFAAPLAEIEHLEARKFDGAAVALGTGVVLGMGLLALAVVGSAQFCSEWDC
jgi:hypothetical protein